MMTQKTGIEAPQVALDSHLPLLSAAGVSARVNAYVAGKTSSFSPTGSEALSPGCESGETDLWYLSLVSPRGAATTVRGIWSHLVDRQGRSAWLEDQTKPNGRGVSLMLGSYRRGLLSTLGWRPHFRWSQGTIGSSSACSSLLEPVELTCWDPLLGQAGAGRQRGTTRSGAASELAQQEEEAEARDASPLSAAGPPPGSTRTARALAPPGPPPSALPLHAPGVAGLLRATCPVPVGARHRRARSGSTLHVLLR